MNDRIFVSYNRQDSKFALKLADDLAAQGINVWIDQRSITPGNRWDLEIEKALSNAEIVLVVLSPHAVASDNVLDEVSFAIDAHKRIIPIIAQECTIPFRLRRFQYIEFSQNYTLGLQSLLVEIKHEQGTLPVTSEKDRKQKKFSAFKKYALPLLGILLIIIVVAVLNLKKDTGGVIIKDLYSDEAMNVTSSVEPAAIRAGEQAEVNVTVRTARGEPVAGANVEIGMGGGTFTTSGSTTESGTTNENGFFATRWISPPTAGAEYGGYVTVHKEGFAEGKSDFSIRITPLTKDQNQQSDKTTSKSELIKVTSTVLTAISLPGEESAIMVVALTSQGAPVAEANVEIAMGGGWFKGSGTTTVTGKTNTHGIFLTRWRAPNPAAAGYEGTVKVRKDGFTEGMSDFTISITQANNGPSGVSQLTATNVTCTASPDSVSAGEQTELKVIALSSQGTPVSDAMVEIRMGGGLFAGSGSTTELGRTDANGIFTTRWKAPKPAAAGYGVSVTVKKTGYSEGKSELTITIIN